MYETTRNSNPPSKRSARVGFILSLPSLCPVLSTRRYVYLCECVYVFGGNMGKIGHITHEGCGRTVSTRKCAKNTFFFVTLNTEFVDVKE